MQDSDTATTDGASFCTAQRFMVYRIAEIPMTLSDLGGHVPIADLLNVIFRTLMQHL